MNIAELRIGNYVDTLNRSNEVHLPNNKPMAIGSLSFFTAELYEINKPYAQQLVPPKIKVFDLERIPLTEEWLVKFGFVENKDNLYGKNWLSPTYGYGKKIRILPCVNKINYLWQYSDYNSITIKYVHQLQNLYFELTGEELTIKKP